MILIVYDMLTVFHALPEPLSCNDLFNFHDSLGSLVTEITQLPGRRRVGI